MSDFLVSWSNNPMGRKVLGTIGLPTPQTLERGSGPSAEDELTERTVLLGGAGATAGTARSVLEAAGATVSTKLGEGEKAHALVFDATAISSVAELRQLYDFFHPSIRSIERCGRVVVLGRPLDAELEPTAAAAAAGLLGFVKSLGKELGRRGATANLLTVATGAEGGLAGPLRFLLSPRSAYVTGQPLAVATGGGAEGPWSKTLEGKTALVTGASRGIGRATARRLAEEGARVLCLDLPGDEDSLEGLAGELGGVAVPLDITSEGAVGSILEAAGGQVDIVVHNAGITRDRTLAKMKPESWDLTLSVNLGAVLATTESLVHAGGIPEGGRVVLVSSVAGIAGNVGQTNYAASKAGVVGLVAALAPRLAEKGITVNAIAPGFIETRLTAAIPFTIREVGRRLCSLSQGGQPVDIAEAIAYFASPGAAGTRGNVLRVCGGNLLGA